MATAQPSPTPTGTYQQPVVSPQPAPAPAVLGTSTNSDWNSQWNNVWNDYWNKGFNRAYGTGSYAGSGDFGSAQSQGYQAGLAEYLKRNQTTNQTTGGTPTPDASTIVPSSDGLLTEIDNVFNPTMDYLKGVEGNVNSNYPTVQNDINAQYNTSKQSLTGDFNRGTTDINAQATEAGGIKEDAVTAAVRLFNELKMGGQQRFGGASSAGQAFGELTSQELQRNVGGIQKSFSSTIQKINASKDALAERFTSALTKLESDKNVALNDARREFDDKLMEIARMKAEANTNKAQMRLQALQELRNQVFQINVQNLNFKQQLAAQKSSADSTLSDYAKSVINSFNEAGNANSSLSQNVTMNPATSLAINSGVGQNQNPSYTGRIKKDEINPTGAISSTPRDEFNYNPLYA